MYVCMYMCVKERNNNVSSCSVFRLQVCMSRGRSRSESSSEDRGSPPHFEYTDER